MPKYLGVLLSLRIIKKEIPITIKKSKKAHYSIADNLFRFWFYACDTNLSYLENGREGFVYDEFVRRNLKSIVAYSFESVSREVVKKLRPFGVNEIGKWWGRDPGKPKGMNEEEIDVVATNDEGREILFGECKWSNEQVGPKIYHELRNKARLVEWHSGSRKEHYLLFSKSGFTERMKEVAKEEKVMLHDLASIERVMRGR